MDLNLSLAIYHPIVATIRTCRAVAHSSSSIARAALLAGLIQAHQLVLDLLRALLLLLRRRLLLGGRRRRRLLLGRRRRRPPHLRRLLLLRALVVGVRVVGRLLLVVATVAAVGKVGARLG